MGVALCFLLFVLLALAWYRQRALPVALDQNSRPASMTFAPQSGQAALERKARLNTLPINRVLSPRAIIVVALLLGASAAAALWTGYGVITASQDIPLPFTEFYAVNTPTIASPNGDTSDLVLQLGVNNKETHPMTYTVQVFVKPSTGGTLAAGVEVISLQDGETWRGTFPVEAGCDDSIAAQLLVPDQPAAYRSIHVRPECGTTPTTTPAP
jgi:hypothetical protein